MTDLIIAGETFNVLIEGDENKEGLMLSNPMATNLHYWDPQIPALAEHFRVVRYDSRGHGASVANQGPYSVEGLGRDALAIMDALRIERVHWLGLSMGSTVGLWLLVHARERIGRAVLASTAAQIPGPDLWNNRIQAARDTGMNGVAMAAAERWFTKTFRDANPEKVEAVMEGAGDAAARLSGRLGRHTRHGSARSHSKHKKQGSGHRRAARSIDTARDGRVGRQFHRRRQIRYAGRLASVEYRG
jgi:3-oxoadipate enol-lactonase